MGLPGSGKTYIAKLLANQLNYEHINSDQVRKEIHKKGHYTVEDKTLVYQEMLRGMRGVLERGQDLIVDTTFYLQKLRDEFQALAAEYTSEIHWIHVTADESIIEKRLSRPRMDSDADFRIFLSIRDQFEKPTMRCLELINNQLENHEIIAKVKEFCDFKNDD